MSKSLAAAVAVSFLAFAPGCRNRPVEADYKKLGYKDNKFTLDGKPFTGIARENHKNGKPSKEYPIRNGLMHGTMREWYENGQLSAETNFDDGKRHGSNRYWDKDGKLTKEQVYDHDTVTSQQVYH